MVKLRPTPAPPPNAPATFWLRSAGGCRRIVTGEGMTALYCDAPAGHNARGGIWQYCDACQPIMFNSGGRALAWRPRKASGLTL